MKVDALKFTDKYIFGSIASVLGVFTRRKKLDLKNNPPKEILIIKLWAIGDAVNSLPLLRSIKENNPKCRITVLTKDALVPVFTQDFIDEIIVACPKNVFKMLFHPRKFDVTFDLEPFLNISAIISHYLGRYRIGFSNQVRSRIYHERIEFSKERHIVDTYIAMGLALHATLKVDRLVPLKYSSKDMANVKQTFEKNKNYRKGKTQIIGICAGVGDAVLERAWPKERFKELSKKILHKHKDCIIVLVGGRSESQLGGFIKDDNERIINTCGTTPLPELFALLSMMDTFISNDTGPMHIAAAQGVKTIGLFGPNTPKIWAPYGKKNISISHKVKGCPYLDNTKHELAPKKLTLEQKKCMESITVDEVLRKI